MTITNNRNWSRNTEDDFFRVLERMIEEWKYVPLAGEYAVKRKGLKNSPTIKQIQNKFGTYSNFLDSYKTWKNAINPEKKLAIADAVPVKINAESKEVPEGYITFANFSKMTYLGEDALLRLIVKDNLDSKDINGEKYLKYDDAISYVASKSRENNVKRHSEFLFNKDDIAEYLNVDYFVVNDAIRQLHLEPFMANDSQGKFYTEDQRNQIAANLLKRTGDVTVEPPVLPMPVPAPIDIKPTSELVEIITTLNENKRGDATLDLIFFTEDIQPGLFFLFNETSIDLLEKTIHSMKDIGFLRITQDRPMSFKTTKRIMDICNSHNVELLID